MKVGIGKRLETIIMKSTTDIHALYCIVNTTKNIEISVVSFPYVSFNFADLTFIRESIH